MGVQECLTEAGKQFDLWLEEPNKRPSPDLRSTIYFYGMLQVGNAEKWNKVWEIYVAEQDAQEKAKLLSCLTAIQVPWILKR